MVEAIKPFKLHPTSIAYIYKVFLRLNRFLWMGIWQHTHTITTTDVSPDLGDLVEIIVSSVGLLVCVLGHICVPVVRGHYSTLSICISIIIKY